MILVGDDQERFEPAEHAVAPPVLGQLDRGPRQIPRIAIELLLELLVQRERISHAAGEPGEHPPALEGAHLHRAALHDGVADGDLPIAAERDLAGLCGRRGWLCRGKSCVLFCELRHTSGCDWQLAMALRSLASWMRIAGTPA